MSKGLMPRLRAIYDWLVPPPSAIVIPVEARPAYKDFTSDILKRALVEPSTRFDQHGDGSKSEDWAMRSSAGIGFWVRTFEDQTTRHLSRIELRYDDHTFHFTLAGLGFAIFVETLAIVAIVAGARTSPPGNELFFLYMPLVFAVGSLVVVGSLSFLSTCEAKWKLRRSLPR